ncbi:2-phospho-L-lactate guanylyltransferase [Haloprofundus halobius]|uniref:2-phospho-L-lactate guanylyltransferase n=1 Tax=Haloprofundus halobius TaxID=2876194 RepID=UPI001CC9ADDB|nr:2-phospho-L-lactate guanylyltransferase [Haloprofundus halobius]
MRVIVPFDSCNPKTRLSEVLSPSEREGFATAMLADVLDAVDAAAESPTVLASGPVGIDAADTIVDERPLSTAVNDQLRTATEPVAVLMADLPLATASALDRLFSASGEVVLARGVGGGTNALVVRRPEFTVDYHDASYLDHLAIARDRGLAVEELDSYSLGIDVDEPADLAEVLLHTDGRSARWLRSAGFTLATDDGRVGVVRAERPAVEARE